MDEDKKTKLHNELEKSYLMIKKEKEPEIIVDDSKEKQ